MSINPLGWEGEEVINDRVRIMRLLIYEGPREWVEQQLEKSITGTKRIAIKGSYENGGRITVRTLEEFPEIVAEHETQEGELL